MRTVIFYYFDSIHFPPHKVNRIRNFDFYSLQINPPPPMVGYFPLTKFMIQFGRKPYTPNFNLKYWNFDEDMCPVMSVGPIYFSKFANWKMKLLLPHTTDLIVKPLYFSLDDLSSKMYFPDKIFLSFSLQSLFFQAVGFIFPSWVRLKTREMGIRTEGINTKIDRPSFPYPFPSSISRITQPVSNEITPSHRKSPIYSLLV